MKRLLASLGVSLLVVSGCASVLGLDEFEDAPDGASTSGDATSSTTGTGTGGSSATTTSASTGGGGGAGASGTGGQGGTGGAPVCTQGETVPCFAGDPALPGHGTCAEGTATCLPDGTGFGDCEGEVLPAAEDCATPFDENCDDTTNEGCACQPGVSATCYAGPAGTENNAPCKVGTQICDASGLGYGPCMGEVLPSAEVCDVALVDEDCDGMANEGCLCTPGTTTACYGGPVGTQNIGICKGGTATCAADGLGYGACVGEVTPAAETCAVTLDEDCSGADCVTWSKGIPANAQAIDTDAQGNVYVFLNSTSTLDFGGGNLINAGSNDLFLAKYGPTGNHIWSKRFGDSADQYAGDVDADASGNTVITGSFNGTVDFGAGCSVTSAGTYDAFVVKFNTTGTCQWAKKYGDTSSQTGSGISFDPNGDVVVGGYFAGVINFGTGNLTNPGGAISWDIFIAKLSGANGSGVWANSSGDTGIQYLTGLDVDAGGNIAICGRYSGTMVLGGGSITANGANDLYLARLDTSGTVSCRSGFATGDNDAALGVSVDSAGSMILAGTIHGSVSLGGAALPFSGPTSASADAFVAKFASNCTHTWSKSFGVASSSEDAVSAAVMKGSDDIVFALNPSAAINLGGGTLPFGGSNDVAIAKLDPNGAHLWSRSYGDSGAQNLPAVAAGLSQTTLLSFSNVGVVTVGQGTFTTPVLAQLAP